MIGVLTHNWAKKGMFEKARELLDGNGLAQSNAPGFISRTTLLARTNSNQISSIVLWDNDGIYDSWKKSSERDVAMAGAEVLWEKSPVSERFDIP